MKFLKLLKDAGVINLYLVTGNDPYSVKAFQKDQKQFLPVAVYLLRP